MRCFLSHILGPILTPSSVLGLEDFEFCQSGFEWDTSNARLLLTYAEERNFSNIRLEASSMILTLLTVGNLLMLMLE